MLNVAAKLIRSALSLTLNLDNIGMDSIADMLTRIRNAQAVGHEKVLVPFSRVKFGLAEILVKEGFIEGAERIKHRGKDFIEITLKYGQDNEGKISGIKKISKPGQRIYIGCVQIRPVKQGYGIAIISTPKGLMTGKEARKQKLGGEVICEVW